MSIDSIFAGFINSGFKIAQRKKVLDAAAELPAADKLILQRVGVECHITANKTEGGDELRRLVWF